MFDKSAVLYDSIYSFKDYDGETAELRRLIAERAPGARSLLDVACGTGKHLEGLGQHFEVSGLDLDSDLLAIAGNRNPGVPLHVGDMVDFDLGRRFGAVTCLFSAIGYARDESRLRRAVQSMARHLTPGGVLLIEPWIFPEDFEDGFVDSLIVEHEDSKVVRVGFSERRGTLSRLEMHYLVRPEGGDVSHFVEEHELGLFSDEQYRAAIAAAGLELDSFDPQGLIGRGLYIALRAA